MFEALLTVFFYEFQQWCAASAVGGELLLGKDTKGLLIIYS
jgi:hypothetical protein